MKPPDIESAAARALAERVMRESPDRPTAIARCLGAMGYLSTEEQDPEYAVELLAVLSGQIDDLRALVQRKVALLDAALEAHSKRLPS